MNEDITKRKLLSAVSHGSIFLSAILVSVGIPIVIFLISDDTIVKQNAQEALNFHLNIWLYGIIFAVLAWVLIGLPLLLILGLVNIIMPIIAILKVFEDPNKVYRYPFIFRVL